MNGCGSAHATLHMSISFHIEKWGSLIHDFSKLLMSLFPEIYQRQFSKLQPLTLFWVVEMDFHVAYCLSKTPVGLSSLASFTRNTGMEMIWPFMTSDIQPDS